MSKSYNNTIPLFAPEKQLKKHINKIKTNLLEPGEPKNPDDSTVFQIWQAFASPEQSAEMRQSFEEGIAWGECKNKLFILINQEVAEARDRYNTLLEHPDDVAAELDKGAKRARARAQPFIAEIKQKIGIG